MIVNEHADLAIFGDFEHFPNDIFGTSSICSVSSVSSVSSFCSVSSGMGWDGIQVGWGIEHLMVLINHL